MKAENNGEKKWGLWTIYAFAPLVNYQKINFDIKFDVFQVEFVLVAAF